VRITQAMILAAGFGKRLHPLTLTTPKPLIPLNHIPIIAYGLDHLKKAGIQRCVINTHYLADQLQNYLKSVSDFEIVISPENEILETAGGIRQALPFFKGQPFYSINSDIWWQSNDIFATLAQRWDPEKMDGLLAVVPQEQAIAFTGPGDYFLQPTGELCYRGTQPSAPYIYAGIQLLHPRIFQDLPLGSPYRLPDLYHQWEAKNRLYGVVLQGPWCDIGTLPALKTLEHKLKKDQEG
jgi:N-acetyl-alpha-D-muramate 1-phosphate uridylyltransferase